MWDTVDAELRESSPASTGQAFRSGGYYVAVVNTGKQEYEPGHSACWDALGAYCALVFISSLTVTSLLLSENNIKLQCG